MSDGSDLVLENAVAVMNSAINISNMAIQNADLAITESSKLSCKPESTIIQDYCPSHQLESRDFS